MPKHTAQSATQKPVQTLRLSRVQASIWANPSADGKVFFNTTFKRAYKDDKGAWHDTDSFGRDDLPLVAKLADEAHTWIFNELAKRPEAQAAK
jgi:hypothetical protein